ncbi:hypothetical protein [Helcobacillus massiliensis]|uniref:DUF4333 domain-containing protein n=1 Tax=Helcobacillus massiliensis TaxID=521392 RepID=A0A839QYC1_9MICO|nr:hypothetical protein [Helcobacillus massiliensis]MBB3023799.1 hypothetical protein [Helcobacillus massiliensis]
MTPIRSRSPFSSARRLSGITAGAGIAALLLTSCGGVTPDGEGADASSTSTDSSTSAGQDSSSDGGAPTAGADGTAASDGGTSDGGASDGGASGGTSDAGGAHGEVKGAPAVTLAQPGPTGFFTIAADDGADTLSPEELSSGIESSLPDSSGAECDGPLDLTDPSASVTCREKGAPEGKGVLTVTPMVTARADGDETGGALVTTGTPLQSELAQLVADRQDSNQLTVVSFGQGGMFGVDQEVPKADVEQIAMSALGKVGLEKDLTAVDCEGPLSQSQSATACTFTTKHGDTWQGYAFLGMTPSQDMGLTVLIPTEAFPAE